jgi:glyoxylase-like metal-dependent hydrolase (beta-lactamase superfamily II)
MSGDGSRVSGNGSRPRVVRVELVVGGFLNAYLVIGERVVVVDAGYPRMATRILAALERESIARSDVSLILLSHGHLDHLGGARLLRERLSAPIAIHELDAPIARTGHDRPLHGTDLFGRVFARFAPRTAPAFEPDIVHAGDLDLALFGVAGRTIHTPGHTPGSVSVLLDDCTLAGDLAAGGLLRRGRPRLPYFADDLDATRRSITLVAGLSRGPVHVGHRGPLDPVELGRRLGSPSA